MTRYLILDRDGPGGAVWVVATVIAPHLDVTAASVDEAGQYRHWESVTNWVAGAVGAPVELTPASGVKVWSIAESGASR